MHHPSKLSGRILCQPTLLALQKNSLLWWREGTSGLFWFSDCFLSQFPTFCTFSALQWTEDVVSDLAAGLESQEQREALTFLACFPCPQAIKHSLFHADVNVPASTLSAQAPQVLDSKTELPIYLLMLLVHHQCSLQSLCSSIFFCNIPKLCLLETSALHQWKIYEMLHYWLANGLLPL